MDLNSIDVITNLLAMPMDFVDNDEVQVIEEQIINQYQDFEDLGINLLSAIADDQIKIRILEKMVDFVNDNYLNIVEYDTLLSSNSHLIQIGEYIYKFVCVDCHNVVLPNLIQSLNDCATIKHFDTNINVNYGNNLDRFKFKVVDVVRGIEQKLQKLQLLDKDILKNKNYNEVVSSYSYYATLMETSDAEKLLFNFMRPMLNKNFESILWRSM